MLMKRKCVNIQMISPAENQNGTWVTQCPNKALFFFTLFEVLFPYGHFLTIYTVWSTSSILVYSGCSNSLANDRSLLDYPGLYFLGTNAFEVYFINSYIVENHVITALYIALWSPGSLFVDVCGIGIMFHTLHASCLGMCDRLKLGSTDSG
jgi:hypothetical protein